MIDRAVEIFKKNDFLPYMKFILEKVMILYVRIIYKYLLIVNPVAGRNKIQNLEQFFIRWWF